MKEFWKWIVLLIAIAILSEGIKAQTSSFEEFANFMGTNYFEGSDIDAASYRLDSVIQQQSPNSSFQAGFVNLLPLAHYFRPEDGVAVAYDALLEQLDTEHQEYFAVISFAQGQVTTHKLEFVLPTGGQLERFSGAERLAIHHQVQNEFDGNLDYSVETATLKALLLLTDFLTGERTIDASYENLGFTRLTFEGDNFPVLVSTTVTTSPTGTNQNVFDYSGLSVGSERIGTSMAAAYGEIPIAGVYVFITSTHSAASASLFDRAATEFGAEEQRISLWLHIHKESDSQYELYAKTHANLGQVEAADYIADYLDYGKPELQQTAARSQPDGPAKSATSQECENFVKSENISLVGFTSGQIEHGRNFSFFCLWEPGDENELPWVLGGSIYQAGVGFMGGLLDGLVGTISVLKLLSTGLNEAMRHNPLSHRFHVELIWIAINERSFIKAWQMKLQGMADFHRKIVGFVEAFYSGWEQIKSTMWNEIAKFFNHLNPTTGLYSTGHALGLVAFEVLIEILTAGTASVLSTGRRIVNMGKSALSVIGHPRSWGSHIASLAEGFAKSGRNVIRDIQLLSHIGQCFIPGTLVATTAPSGYTEIQNIRVFDMVMTDSTKGAVQVRGYNTKSDQLVSAEQVAIDILGHSTTVDWKVAELKGITSSTKFTVARPVVWFNRYGFKNIGDRAPINLPELGLVEEFALSSWRELTLIEKQKLSAVGPSRPVLSTISHQAELVLRLNFESDMVGVTPLHKFYNVTRGEWTAAKDIRVGEVIETLSGSIELCSRDTLATKLTPVHNLEVSQHHNYFVGKKKVLVHNYYSARWVKNLRSKYSSRGTVYKANRQIDEFATTLVNMSEDRLRQFYDDLGIPEGTDIPRANVKEVSKKISLVRAWEQAFNSGLPVAARRNPQLLETLTDIVDNVDFNRHIFQGDLVRDASGNVRSVSGVHSNSAITVQPGSGGPFVQGDIRYKSGTIDPPNPGQQDYYRSKVEVYGTNYDAQGNSSSAWRTKSARSTFFPDGWSPEKIQAEVAYGFQNKQYIRTNSSNGANIYHGTMSDGTTLEIVMENGVMTSAYPNLNP